jgi:hypothetical protein
MQEERAAHCSGQHGEHPGHFFAILWLTIFQPCHGATRIVGFEEEVLPGARAERKCLLPFGDFALEIW